MGEHLMDGLEQLTEKHAFIGDVRGKDLLAGVALVQDRESKAPVDESVVMSITAECMALGVIFGRTNRSFREFNNTIAPSPALIATRSDIEEIVHALDQAIATVGGNLQVDVSNQTAGKNQ